MPTASTVFTRLAAEAFAKSFGMVTLPIPLDAGTITNLIWHARNSRSPSHIWMREQIKAVYDRFD